MVPQTLGRSRLQQPRSPGRLNGHGWAASGPLQGASGQWPDPSPGANSPPDCLCPGSACSAWPRVGARGGARACNPKCVRIFSITGCSRIAAMIFSSPPQFGQCSMSISNTRLSRPAQANRSVVRAVRLALGGWRGLRGRLSLLRHHLRAQLGVGSQHTMEADQVQSRAWHQRCQPLHELQRAHHQVRGAVSPGGLELEHHLACGVGLHPFVGQCRAGDVAAQLPQRLPVVGRAAGVTPFNDHAGLQWVISWCACAVACNNLSVAAVEPPDSNGRG